MLLEKAALGPFETNCYLFGKKKIGVIDPGEGAVDWIMAQVERRHLEVDKILLTHSHWDHIYDAAELKEKTKAPIFVHKLDAPNLERPGEDGLPLFAQIHGVKPDHYLENGQILEIDEIKINVIATPGHSPGGVSFYLEKEKILFSGDTLFRGSLGNLSFPTSDPSAMWKSLKTLAKLPGETKVLPGHGPDTSIENERWMEQAEQLYMR